MTTPPTTQFRERPVWRRWRLRSVRNTEAMPPPTDEEKHDAILVLQDPDNEAVLGLWIEAHMILDQASQ